MGKKSAPSKQGAPANQRLSAGGISVFSPLVDPIFPYQVYAGKKSRNSNSGPRKKPMASMKRLMIYSTKSIKEHTILTCGRTRFNIYDHSPSPT